MAPLPIGERHQIWLRLCHIASIALATVRAAQVPFDAIPMDALDAPPQPATEFLSAIPAADPPADPV